MKPVVRNILAVLAGVVIGSIVNMAIVTVSGKIIPPPNGADVTSLEGLRSSIHLFEPKHFLMPFLAHALGTLVGAAVATVVAASHRLQMAMIIGAFFLLGGIANVMMIPGPMWFNAVDLIGAYFPMAWLGWIVAGKKA